MWNGESGRREVLQGVRMRVGKGECLQSSPQPYRYAEGAADSIFRRFQAGDGSQKGTVRADVMVDSLAGYSCDLVDRYSYSDIGKFI